MRAFIPLLALALLAPLTGCRDSIVGPLPQDAQPPLPGPQGEDRGDFYLKGPGTVAFGQEIEFRTEPNAESARFAWFFEGEPLLEVAQPSSRVTTMTARNYGTTVLIAVHYDAAGRVLGMGRKRVSVVAD